MDNYDKERGGARRLFEQLITKRKARNASKQPSTELGTTEVSQTCEKCAEGDEGLESSMPSGHEAKAANNKQNKATLARRFPGYCTHELYFHHLRGSTARRCSNELVSQQPERCKYGRHDTPPGFATKTRDINWN